MHIGESVDCKVSVFVSRPITQFFANLNLDAGNDDDKFMGDGRISATLVHGAPILLSFYHRLIKVLLGFGKPSLHRPTANFQGHAFRRAVLAASPRPDV